MYDSSSFFNEEKLFLRFNGLKKKFENKADNSDEKNEKMMKILKFDRFNAEFLFKISRLYIIKSRINQYKELVEIQAKEISDITFKGTNGENRKLKFSKDYLLEFGTLAGNELLSMVSPYLNLLFILQDRVMNLLGMVLDIYDTDRKFPYFFYHADGKAKLLEFGDKITNLANFYWKKNAQRIRMYRNLDQHMFSVLDHYGINHNGKFVIHFPDNPKEKNYYKITYNKKIDGIKLINDSFDAFHDFLEIIMEILGFEPKLYCVGYRSPQQLVHNFKKDEGMFLFQNGNSVIVMYGKGSMNILPLKKHQIIMKIG